MENTVTTSAHTAGPWTVSDITCLAPQIRAKRGKHQGRLVAYVSEEAEEKEANARLIATAPELLKLVKLYKISCEERIEILLEEKLDWEFDEGIDEQLGHWDRLLGKCNAVLAAAQGN
jgi:hypothetical protein